MSDEESSVLPTVHGRNGGRLLAGGKKGHKGGGGRPPEEFRELCREMVSSPAALKGVKAILADTKHPHYVSLYKYLADRGYGKPEQPISHGTQDGGAMSFTLNLGDAAIRDS
jgi:hypothetical protein